MVQERGLPRPAPPAAASTRTRPSRPRTCRRRHAGRGSPAGPRHPSTRTRASAASICLAAVEERDEQAPVSLEHHRALEPVGKPGGALCHALVVDGGGAPRRRRRRTSLRVRTRSTSLDRQPRDAPSAPASSTSGGPGGRLTTTLHLRPPERLGTSRPAGEEPRGTITDGSGMVNEGLERRTALTRGGKA